MNELEFKELWNSEKPAYSAWGDYIIQSITQDLEGREVDLSTFLKIPVKYRLKDDNSLIDKAFFRPGKNYSDPYNQIEDKVGIRFVVLLLEDIEKICEIVEESDVWQFDACKHFDEDKERDPLLFTYQSVHYVLRPKNEMEIDGVTIPCSIPCEVQIRTLLQHAHAELTHDAVYKAKKTVQPAVHRTVAKSMALIETTDEFFSEVTQELNRGPLDDHAILNRLDGIYYSITGLKSHNQKSSLTIWDEFESLVDAALVDSIQSFISKNPHIPEIIKSKYSKNPLYQQSTVLFIYWLLKRKKNKLLNNWPLDRKILDPFANDLGVSIWDGD
ncbi:GTP pyrophosphokinase [Microbulbifer sp. JTAC008]|uniref:GTP pyrophosphokinase n=1 Tax=unclassified Microbulbifer TaxID=2619833 RepID=UPI00403A1988